MVDALAKGFVLLSWLLATLHSLYFVAADHAADAPLRACQRLRASVQAAAAARQFALPLIGGCTCAGQRAPVQFVLPDAS